MSPFEDRQTATAARRADLIATGYSANDAELEARAFADEMFATPPAKRLNGPQSDGNGADVAEHLGDANDAPQARIRRALKLQTVAELLKQPRPVWLVRDVLPRGGLAVAYGEPGCGKTFLVLDLAAAIAQGEPWLGKRTKRGGVVYVACEGTLRGRVEAYLVNNALDPRAVDFLRIVPHAVNLLDPRADTVPLIEAAHQFADEAGPVALIVVDTLNRAMPGGNENAAEDMGALISNAKRIQEATGAAVLFVHHSGKDSSKGSRGHSSLKGAADLEIEIKADELGQRCATVVKAKDGTGGAQIHFRLVPVDLGPSDDPEAEPGERDGSCVIEQADSAPSHKSSRYDLALDALREALSEYGRKMPGTSSIPPGVCACTLDQWLARWRLRTGDDYTTTETATSAFRRERLKLLKAETIRCSGVYVWLT